MFNPIYWHTHRVKVVPKFINNLWWRFMPGTIIKVKWPVGEIRIKHQSALGIIWENISSADPNAHYRPYLETNVGRQGWDWDWTMMDSDCRDNTLTIKFRKGKESWASLVALMWG